MVQPVTLKRRKLFIQSEYRHLQPRPLTSQHSITGSLSSRDLTSHPSSGTEHVPSPPCASSPSASVCSIVFSQSAECILGKGLEDPSFSDRSSEESPRNSTFQLERIISPTPHSTIRSRSLDATHFTQLLACHKLV